jgi:hypothetical protein
MYEQDALLPQDLKFHIQDNRKVIEKGETDKDNYQYTLSKTLLRGNILRLSIKY